MFVLRACTTHYTKVDYSMHPGVPVKYRPLNFCKYAYRAVPDYAEEVKALSSRVMMIGVPNSKGTAINLDYFRGLPSDTVVQWGYGVGTPPKKSYWRRKPTCSIRTYASQPMVRQRRCRLTDTSA